MTNSIVFVALPLLAFSGAVMYVLPYLSPRRYFFTITVPKGFVSTDKARSVTRTYHARLTAALLFSIGSVWVLGGPKPEFAFLYATLLPLIGGMICYLMARNQVRAHSVSGETVREAELSTAPDHLPRWVGLAVPPFAAPVAVAAYLRAHWDNIPVRFPVHFDLAGNPNRWVEKTARGVYGLPVFDAGLMLLILLVGLATFWGSRRGPQRSAVLKIIIAAEYLLGYEFTIVALLPLIRFPIAAHLVPTFVFVIAIMVWSYKMATDPDMPVDTTPDECWRLGSIYYNRNDPAIFVQKRIGYGYTLNFAHPVAWGGMGLFVFALVGLILLIK